MNVLGDAFADSVFWISLIAKRDQFHLRAQTWSKRIKGRIITSRAVVLETANALSQPESRAAVIALLGRLETHPSVEIVPFSEDLWQRSWELYSARADKAWSLTDCASFIIMKDLGLSHALTADKHFLQAGYRAMLLEEAGA